MTMTDLLLFGALVGFFVGLASQNDKTGYIILLFAPVIAFIYTYLDQRMNSEALSAFSGIDLIADPFWFSIGAACGVIVGRLMRTLNWKK